MLLPEQGRACLTLMCVPVLPVLVTSARSPPWVLLLLALGRWGP